MFNIVLKLVIASYSYPQDSKQWIILNLPRPSLLASVIPHSLAGLSHSSLLNIGVPYDPGLCLLLFFLYDSLHVTLTDYSQIYTHSLGPSFQHWAIYLLVSLMSLLRCLTCISLLKCPKLKSGSPSDLPLLHYLLSQYMAHLFILLQILDT